MKAKNVNLQRSLGGVVCAGALLFIAGSAPGQNVFVANYTTGDIYKITPGQGQTVFAQGLDYPVGLAFDSSGDLFVANSANNFTGQGYITEFKPGQNGTTFAAGITPSGLVTDSAGDVYVADYRSGNILEYGPGGGSPTTYAAGFANPETLAFDNSGDLFVGAGYGSGNGYITEIKQNKTQVPFASGLTFPYLTTRVICCSPRPAGLMSMSLGPAAARQAYTHR